jgi:4-oxalocrotonate tautomerase
MRNPQSLHALAKLLDAGMPRPFLTRSGMVRKWEPEEGDREMPLVDIQLIEGVFSSEQKKEMIEKITDTMVQIEGEAMRGVTWVRVHELGSGEWGIGGKALTTADVKALQATGA